MDEFFEVLTWAQLGLHDKPILVLNTKGYWDPLLALLERIVTEGFAEPTILDFVTVVPDAAAMVAALVPVLDA